MRWLWRRSPKRTLVLGVLALGVLLWGAITQFELPREQVLSTLWATLLSLGLVIALAALGAALWVLLRQALSDRDDD